MMMRLHIQKEGEKTKINKSKFANNTKSKSWSHRIIMWTRLEGTQN